MDAEPQVQSPTVFASSSPRDASVAQSLLGPAGVKNSPPFFPASEANRKYIIKDLNRLDAVIGLPANLFHGTGIPVCVLVLKSKRNGNSGNILFIDASKEFKAGKNQNVLEQEHIDKIVDAYAKRVDVDKFAHVADMSEIIENGYNLNIPRYVDTFEEEEPVDLDAVKAQIKTLDSETKAAIDKAESFMRQLGL